jgi:hypothetical protein
VVKVTGSTKNQCKNNITHYSSIYARFAPCLQSAFSAILRRKLMSETPTPTPMQKAALVPILERSALPLLLFCGMLFVLLFISWFGILPRFTRFSVSDALLSPTEMEAYVSTMRANVQSQEEKRNRLVLPLNDSLYTTLKADKRSTFSAGDIRSAVLQLAVGLGDTTDALFLEHIAVDNDAHIATLSGDIRNIGPRSMTVLATLVERIETLPFVTHVEPPPFTRAENADGSLHSPFSMTLTLQSQTHD